MASNFRLHISIRVLGVFALAAASCLLNGCLTRTREPQYRMSTADLQSATLSELVERVNHDAEQIKTLKATVEIAASTGGQKKGKITDYTEIHGFVLVREPDMLRVIGLVPVVRNTLFDMVSDGKNFQLLIPAKNKVIMGGNKVTKPSSNELQNLRPDAFFDSLLLHKIGPDEIAFLHVGKQRVRDLKTKKEAEQPNYVVNILRKKSENDSEWYLSRAIYFDRVDLQMYRQVVFDELGQTVTEADYANFSTFDGIPYPALIDIKRPIEEIELKLTISKLTINKPLPDETFELKVPPGTQVQKVDEPSSTQSALNIDK